MNDGGNPPNSFAAWSEREDLPERQAWLLEASAGTGKTFQIAGLVVRLVAEYGVPIDRILAITFTNAATAELRDRVRKRLASVLRELRGDVTTSTDPFVAHLRSLSSPPSDVLAQRLEDALRDFDLAAISTIHGFSQRMLSELAFDSGQDPDLELLSDADDVVEELVDDELARFFHASTVDEVGVYRVANLTREHMIAVARALCAAVAPTVVPARAPGAEVETRERARAFIAARARVRHLFVSPAAKAAFKRLEEFIPFINRGKDLGARLGRVQGWFEAGAPPLSSIEATQRNAVEALRAPTLRAGIDSKCKKKAVAAQLAALTSDLTKEPFWPALQALDEFVATAEQFWSAFVPLADFAHVIRARFEAEVRRRRVLTFDGMLSRLAERIRAEGDASSPVAQRIRERYDVALVDEFQDTDSAQWTVLQAAFLGHRRLFLIGDPKQAIYAFRGADVHVYARAAHALDAAQRRTMKTNHRSDPAVLGAMNTLWRQGSGAFDEAAFDYVDVDARAGAAQAQARAQAHDGQTHGLEVRWVDARVFGGADGDALSAKQPGLLARLAADEVVAWLSAPPAAGSSSTTTTTTDAGDGARSAASPTTSRRPNQIAVLVNDHRQAARVTSALREARVPAVAAARTSVFATPVATWIAAWLDAVATAGRDREARAAVVTPLFGWTADDLAWALAFADRGDEARDEARRLGRAPDVRGKARAWEEWTASLHAAAANWSRQGFARVFDGELATHGVLTRVLSLPDGERHATDLRHLFELVHAHERTTRTGPAALATWLRDEETVESDDRRQRLESDADAVRVETIHASKGLEYPYVLLPFAGDARKPKEPVGPVVLRDENGTRVDLSPASTPARDQAIAFEREAARREDLRKLYVAMTRAKHRTIAWYGPMGEAGCKAASTALGRVLLRPADATSHVDAALPVLCRRKQPDPQQWSRARDRLGDLVRRSGGAFVWTPVPPLAPAALTTTTAWTPPPPATPTLEPAPWNHARKSLRGRFVTTSYTGLSTGSAIGAEATARAVADTADGAATDATDGAGDAARNGLASSADEPGALRLDDDPRTGLDEHPVEPALADKPPYVDLGDVVRLRRGGGADYGTFVHEVFERLDFTTLRAKTGASLDDLIDERASRTGQARDKAVVGELKSLLPALVRTPLDGNVEDGGLRGLPAGFTLGDIATRDRVDELKFDLRLGAGVRYVRGGAMRDAATGARVDGCVDPQGVRRALEAALSAPAAAAVTPVKAWVQHHARRAAAGASLVSPIVGVLTGSIDLVFRVRGDADAGDGVYFLADYKTNKIASSESGHYASPWLAWKMATVGYPLQALLYTVALHRHLRLRMGPRYDYDRHVGGTLYLFVRGMAGLNTPRDPQTGHCLGVFAHRWTRDTIDLMDRALAPEVTP